MLALVGHSVRESASAPLDLSLLARYLDINVDMAGLFWRGDSSLVEEAGLLVGLEWEDDANPAKVELVIDYSSDQLRSYVRGLRLTDRDQRAVHWEVNRGEPSLRRFVSMADLDGAPLELSFVGLVPPAGIPQVEGVRARMLGLRDRIQWLRGVRVKPPSSFSSTGAVPRLLEPDGSDAVQVLLTDPALRSRVADFYETACDRVLELKDVRGGQYGAFLTPKNRLVKEIPLQDTGEGMAQCLPVVVAGAMAERSEGPRVVLIEEPDSHLHPRVQVALANFLCEVANAPHRPALVLETHSFALMLGVQLAIARGRIRPEDVCVYWLDAGLLGATYLNEVTFDAKGTPNSDALLDVFAEESRISQMLSDIYVAG